MQQNVNQQNAPQQQSGLGIAGMIIGIISFLLSCILIGGFTSVIGLILSFVAFFEKNKKHTMSIIGIIFNSLGILISIIMFIAIMSTDNIDTDSNIEDITQSEYTTPNVEEETTEPTITQEPDVALSTIPISETEMEVTEEPIVVEESFIDCTIRKCDVKYTGYELITDRGDNDCIVVYYEFTNNSDENKEFYTTVSDKAFQNGIELEGSIWKVEGYGDHEYLEIKPGSTLTVACSYVLRDNSDVELEMHEWVSFSDKPKASMIIEIE